MIKLAVFVSGSGSDMQCIINAVKARKIKAQIALVIASKAGIYAIKRAERYGIATAVFDKKEYASLAEMDEAISQKLKSEGIDIVVLAGYLNIITPTLIDSYRNRIVNIHPSLIPRHCGKGFYGMRVHEAVASSGDKITGATVHFVDEGADTGKIISRTKVKVYKGDSPKTIAARVLKAEHRLLPRAVAQVCKSIKK